MNGWGYFLSTPSDGKTASLKNNCDPTTGRFLILDASLEYPPNVDSTFESLLGKNVII